MRFRFLFLLVAATLAVPALPGCGPQKKKSEIRAEEGAAALNEAMAARRKRILAMLPTDDEPGSEEHPWLAWIKRAVATTPANEVKKAGLKGKGSKVEDQAQADAAWLETQRDYYRNEKIAPNDYWRELSLARRAGEGQPWAEDVEFDVLFLHASELAHTHNLFAADPHDDRVTRFFTYWKWIFDFKPETSLFEEECNRLCEQKLGEFCKKIPMEERPFQIMKPYYEGYVKQVEAFKAKFPQSPYNAFLDRIAAQYKTRAAKVPGFDEFPVLPGIRSTIPAPIRGNAVLSVTQKGVALMDNLLRSPENAAPDAKPGAPAWKPDWTPDPKLLEQAAALVEDVRSSTISAYNQSSIFIVPEAQVPVGYLESIMRAIITGERSKEWTTMILTGRRRGDASNRRAGFTLSLMAKDKAVPFKLKAPGGKAMQCVAWAVVGKDLFDAKGFKPVVFHDGKQVHTGRLADDGTIQSLQSAPGHGEGDRLETWADQQTSSIVVAVAQNAPYEAWLEALNGVALHCDKDGCGQLRTQPVFVGTCK